MDDYDDAVLEQYEDETAATPEYTEDPEPDIPDDDPSEQEWNQKNQRYQSNQDEAGCTETEDHVAEKGMGDGKDAPPQHNLALLVPLGPSGSTGAAESSDPSGSTPRGRLHPRIFGPRERGELLGQLEAFRVLVKTKNYPAYRVAFEFARLGKRYALDALDLEDIALDLFRSLDLKPEECFAEMLVAWEKVRFPDGVEPWNHAFDLSQSFVYEFTPASGTTLRPYANFAYQLSRIHGPECPFLFPVKLVAETMGVSVAHAANCINALVRRELMECTDRTWSYTDGRSREFIFVAKSNGCPMRPARKKKPCAE